MNINWFALPNNTTSVLYLSKPSFPSYSITTFAVGSPTRVTLYEITSKLPPIAISPGWHVAVELPGIPVLDPRIETSLPGLYYKFAGSNWLGPGGPSGPSVPLEPGRPCDPCSPCRPWGPAGPGGPWGPIAPVAPGGP